MKIYNTLSRKKEDFIPLKEGQVKIYACGPTVYNYIHIGNARPICVSDVLRRFLEYKGFEVIFVQNFTDIDDKIIRKAIEEKSDYLSVSKKYINEYKIDANGLNINEATYHPLATENIDQIIKIISILISKGFAYKAKNEDVYFRTKNFKEYGRLSCQVLDDLELGARIEVEDQKENPMDFTLWKAAKPGEPAWDSPFGKGRPGWHIECSAMAKRYLGDTIDIHCGGQDLIFPHHENEIAQSECANGCKFVRYWFHNGYINVDNRKMSKSLNNFFTVREISERYGYGPIRYLMISSHYRSPINYSEEIILQCKSALDRLKNCRENLEFTLKGSMPDKDNCKDEDITLFSKHMNNFVGALDDDLNTADAIACLFDLTKDVNLKMSESNTFCADAIRYAIKTFDKMLNILGLDRYICASSNIEDNHIKSLIDRRNQARKDKDFCEADRIRDELKCLGYVIEDTKNGTKIKRCL